jgi:hypothetical protein
MAVTITVIPTVPKATKDFCKFDIAGQPENDATAYNVALVPTEPQIGCYLKFVKGGVEYGRSYVFATSADGTHQFNDYVFPSAGSWSAVLCRADNDAVLKTQAVTVS